MARRTVDSPSAPPEPATTDPAPAGAAARVQALKVDDSTETWPAQLAEQQSINGGLAGSATVGASLVVAGDTVWLLGIVELVEIKHAAVAIAADADVISRLDGLREQALSCLRDGRPVAPEVVGGLLDQARAWVAVRGLNGGKPA